MAADYLVGIDIGGTFTDIVIAREDGSSISALKVLTTPSDPAKGVITGMRRGLELASVRAGAIGRVVHATTLATNLILERRGTNVAFVTTEGFGDLARIGRFSRLGTDRFDMYFARPPVPVAEEESYEVAERMSARGEVMRPIDPVALSALYDRIAARAPTAVAVCLLNSYVNPLHEQLVTKALRARLPHVYVTSSSEVWPEFREFDRAMTTIASAYVGPVLGRYLNRLEAELRDIGIRAPLQVMQSNGGVIAASHAVSRAVYAIESGPAAGVVAASHVGRLYGHRNVIAFDMGGTTAKAGLVRDGEPTVTHEFHVGGTASTGTRGGGIPIQIPVIDLAEVGSGGGSIAWVDAAGVLHVGPQSAGADPGPACYGLGGTEPTVTDADLLLGYLDGGYFVGGEMKISVELARAAIARVADQLGLDPVRVAVGIHDIANANMAAAIKRVTVERGIDPREFTAVASGGAGPVHIARVAGEFQIPRIIVSPFAGVMSALGLIATDLTTDHVRTRVIAGAEADAETINAIFEELENKGLGELEAHGFPRARVSIQRTVEMRYHHQAHSVPVPVPTGKITTGALHGIAETFFSTYQTRFGIRSRDPTELVSFKVRLIGEVPKVRYLRRESRPGNGSQARIDDRPVYFSEFKGYRQTPVYERERLEPGDGITGPAIVREKNTTVVLPPGHRLTVDDYANLLIEPTPGQAAGDVTATVWGESA